MLISSIETVPPFLPQQISPDVFKGLASLLKHAVKGIEQVGDSANTSGIGSIFTLLEVAYTRHMGAYGKG